MNYPSLGVEILQLFAEAQHLRRERPNTIARLIGRGHWHRELVEFWHRAHRLQVQERKRLWEAANRAKRRAQMRINCRRYRARVRTNAGGRR